MAPSRRAAVGAAVLGAWLLGCAEGDQSPTCEAGGQCEEWADDMAEVSLLQKAEKHTDVLIDTVVDTDSDERGTYQRCHGVGARGWMSVDGMNYMLGSLMPEIVARATKVDIPYMRGTKSGFKYLLSHAKITEFTMDAPYVRFEEGVGVHVQFTGFRVVASVHYQGEGDAWYNPMWSAGWITADLAQKSDVSGIISFDVTDEGRPKIELDMGSLGFELGKFDVEGTILEGILELLASIFKSNLEGMFTSSIKDIVEKSANTYLNDFFASMGLKLPLPLQPPYDIAAADMTFCYIDVRSDYIAIGLLGAFVEDEQVFTFPAKPRALASLPPAGFADKMLAFRFSNFTLSSACYIFQREGLLKTTIQPGYLAKDSGISLEMKTAQSFFRNSALPRDMPENANFVVDISSENPPVVLFDNGKINIEDHIRVDFRWEEGQERTGVFLSFTAPVNASAVMTITEDEEEVVDMQLDQISCTPITIIDVNKDVVNIDAISEFIQVLVKTTLLPYLNGFMSAGVPLSESHGLRLTASEMTLSKGIMDVTSDFTINLDAFNSFIDGLVAQY
mmetsp:Transcript_115375/g.322508  ORF Transcript_115375/g.322508 Transcript_115375/m.322508 type:complete len:562 (+) Transcript_115375:65-1750(+)